MSPRCKLAAVALICAALSRVDAISVQPDRFSSRRNVNGQSDFMASHVSRDRRTDEHLLTNPRVDVCFVHVGKCGGGTINTKLQELAAKNPASSYLEIHVLRLSRDNPASENRTSVCLKSELIVIWVRDPVDRLISSWRWALSGYGYGKQETKIQALVDSHPDVFPEGNGIWDDLDWVASCLALNGDEELGSEFLGSFHHGHQSLSWYLNGDCAIVDEMKNVFVGRVEYMEQDWAALMQRMQVPSIDVDLQKHKTEAENKTISPVAFDFLHGLRNVQEDLKCMQKLAKKGLLSQDYVDEVTSSRHHVLRAAEPAA